MLLGVLAGRRTRSGSDYTVAGRKAGAGAVAGILLGALVGGASTVGTVQMAYGHGLSAWWFTLGGGIGCLLLGLRFAGPLRRSGLETIPQLLGARYGAGTGRLAMAAASAGTYISIVAQFLAGLALLRSVLPLSTGQASFVLALSVTGFILFGGLKSFGALGKAKIALLYVVMASCAAASAQGSLRTLATLPFSPYFNPFGRGLAKDMGALTSLVVGVFTTQIYIQSFFAASDERSARRGAFLSALLMPPLGLLGIFVGLTLRGRAVVVDPAQALPRFIVETFSPWAAGILWSGLFITVVGCAAGLTLGVATNVVRDVLIPLVLKGASEKTALIASRLVVVALVFSAALLGALGEGSMILTWSYLSMGLRGAGTFFPFVMAVVAPGRLSPSWALAASLSGLAALFVTPLFGTAEPLFVGLAFSGGVTFVGLVRRKGTA